MKPASGPRDIWFPAKRYGWGWGLPVAWQGWVVIGVYIALLVLGAVVLRGRLGLGGTLLYVGALTAALVGICWTKGERPRWRWGS